MVVERYDIVTTRDLAKVDTQSVVIAGNIKGLTSVKTNSIPTGGTSSLDSISWNDMVNQENKLITSTPQADSTEECTESFYKNILDLIGDIKKLELEISHICKDLLIIIHGTVIGDSDEV